MAKKGKEKVKRIITFFSLFGSMGTLLCCALPVTLVTIGMGATFASLTSLFPQLIWLAERKDQLFIFTALMLITSFVMIKKSEKLSCPTDAEQNEICQITKPKTMYSFWISCIMFIIGLTFSYILPAFI